MKKMTVSQTTKPPAPAAGRGFRFYAARAVHCAYLAVVMSMVFSTVAAIVTASVALLMMNFSRSGKTVDESRAWLKRICLSWAIINGLGFIMAYITPFFADGKWIG